MATKFDETIPGVPGRFRWLGTPVDVRYDDQSLMVSVGPRTDWFVDPESNSETLNAPALVRDSVADFSLSARVEPTFESAFDAGALVLWHDSHTWAKLAFEFSPQGRAMVVSVVTRGASDDCNGVVVDAATVWLRVSRRGGAHAFHYSLDANEWHFVRHFRLNHAGTADVGFEAQSPLGEGCVARFVDIAYSPEPVADLRSGV